MLICSSFHSYLLRLPALEPRLQVHRFSTRRRSHGGAGTRL